MSAECSIETVPPGYKQTEVGVIPEDWEVKSVGEAFEVHNHLRVPISQKEREKIAGKYPYYGPTGIQGYINEYRIEGQYALIGEDGDHFLKWREMPMTLMVSGKFNVNNHAHVVKGTNNLTAWFYYYFSHRDLTQHLTRQGAGRYKLTKKTLLNIQCVLPSPSEQKAITEALSDTDALIESLEQLIAKKCQIKQGAMQELLTGKRRLPEFEIKRGYKQTEVGVIPEDWNIITLSRITSEIGDGIHSTPEYSINGDYFFVNGNNIQNGCIVITKDTKSTNFPEYNKHKKNLSSDRTLLLSINGTIGNVAFYSGEPIFLGKSAAYINVNENISRLLAFYLLQTANVTAYFNEGLTGTTIKNLGLNTIRNTPVPIPPTEAEQEAIATILSDMDSEITSLEEKLAKARQIKQGMMQELLTGRVRLV